MKQIALTYLKQALNNPNADFRDGQWESIEQLLNKKRALVVQRTGWGKSMVYFLTAKLLREQGSGLTLIISPLLSLMRNQLEAAARIGINAFSINSTNNSDWEQIELDLTDNKVDILLISPERLSNDEFTHNTLSKLSQNIGLFVIDEAHCISDWGHDFRPDYRRIIRVLRSVPDNVPVLATTATANDRVVKDIESQLGSNLLLIRGSLIRTSLKLQNITLTDRAARMAWLAQTIPSLVGSGIVYVLTKRDADNLAEWLQKNNIEADVYHADKSDEVREMLEQKLLNNEIKALVATVALGMGFDKPDLGFVIHFQRPSSAVHYYQQVGRAGRAIDNSHGVLLCGEEDDEIAEYFIKSAFPPQGHIYEILGVLEKSEEGLSVNQIQIDVNLNQGQVTKALKFLSIESPSPVTKIGTKWQATATALTYKVDNQYIKEITDIRQNEQKEMQKYMEHKNCLMTFLQSSLDDISSADCQKCCNCRPDFALPEIVNDELVKKAELYLRKSYMPIKPRQKWPQKDILKMSQLDGYNIAEELQASEGRVLTSWHSTTWGKLVANGKYIDKYFSDELVHAIVVMVNEWNPPIKWVTCIPSLKHTDLVPNFSKRVADVLCLPFIQCIDKKKNNEPQKSMNNSYRQVKNLDGVFQINADLLITSPCLLIDDIVDSGWTFTVASALLRKFGVEDVYPLALSQAF